MMQLRTCSAIAITLVIAPHLAFADSSYQRTEQVGGAIADQVKALGVFGSPVSKMFAPTTTLTMVQGNRKAIVSKASMEIFDMDSETITRVDMEKKTYSVVTFAQFRDALKQLPATMKQGEDRLRAASATQDAKSAPQATVDVSVKNTGAAKMVNGQMAQEQIVTMKTTIANPNVTAGNPVTTLVYVTTTDTWIAPDPPEVKDVEAFDARLAMKMFEGVDVKGMFASMQDARKNAGFAQMFGNQPGAAEAYKKMEQEKAKLKGTHVLEVTTMTMSGLGPDGTPVTASGAGAPGATPAGPAPTTGSLTKDAATDAATQSAGTEAGRLGSFGSIVGNSAIGLFRKKKAASAAAAPAPATAPGAATPPAAPGAGTPAGSAFMSTTTSMTNFSQEPIPASAFAVPTGFKRVPSPYGALAM